MLNCNPRHKRLKYILGMLLMILVTVSGLTGCLVKKKDLEKFARTTDYLRIYQHGDRITYNVIATTVSTSGTSTQTGTLTVRWEDPGGPLIRPDTLNPVNNVIKEITELSLGGATPEGTIKYVTQDVNGQITLHAYEASSAYFWLNSSPNTGATTTESFVIFDSPITTGTISAIHYYLLEGCSEATGICGAAVGSYEDNQDVAGDSWEVETNKGIYLDPFRIGFHGNANPMGGYSDLPGPLDIRNICSTGINQFGTSVGSGTMYVMPEIGIIKMENTCRDALSDTYTHYIITLSNTTFSLPW